MTVLLDQNAPRPLAKFLRGHEVITSADLGWSTLKNGDLIRVAEDKGFDVMVTADKNLFYQQNLKGRTLAIVVLPSGQWPRVAPYIDAVVCAVNEAKPGVIKRSLRLQG